jgi:hypothetical protein
MDTGAVPIFTQSLIRKNQELAAEARIPERVPLDSMNSETRRCVSLFSLVTNHFCPPIPMLR